MASPPDRRQADETDEALESVREALPAPDEDDLVEHRPDEEPADELQPPLHDPLWGLP